MTLEKKFACRKCRCRRFWRVVIKEQIVDWNREGAVTGHPFLEGAPLQMHGVQFRCAECDTYVDNTKAAEMEREVL